MVAQTEVRREIPEWEQVKERLSLQGDQRDLDTYRLFYQTQVLLAQDKKSEAEELFRQLDTKFNFEQFEKEHRFKLDAITGLVRPIFQRY